MLHVGLLTRLRLHLPTLFQFSHGGFSSYSPQVSASPAEQIKKRHSLVTPIPRLRITCFWHHDLQAIWNFNTSASICQQLSTMVLSLYKTVKLCGSCVPLLAGHGYGISIERMRFQLDRQALTAVSSTPFTLMTIQHKAVYRTSMKSGNTAA